MVLFARLGAEGFAPTALSLGTIVRVVLNPIDTAVSVRPADAAVAIGSKQDGPAPTSTGNGQAAIIAARLKESIGDSRFERDFFNGSTFRQERGGEVVIRVSSQAAAEVLQRRYAAVLVTVAEGVPGGGVRFIVEQSVVPAAMRKSDDQVRDQRDHKTLATARQRGEARPVFRKAKLNELVISPQNRMAVDAARRVAVGSLPGGCLLFVHGGCGLGKTHMLAAVAEEAGARHGTNARCMSGEQFANEFIAAVKAEKGDRMDRFRRQYRSLDVLCIDDVQGLQGKNATQQELQHTVDALLSRGARVVVSSSCHPRRLEQFSDALVSRLMGGLVVEVLPPDPAAAKLIVQALAARRGMVIEPAAAEAVAMSVINDPRCGSRALSIRELEGIVTKVEAVHRLLGAGVVPGDISAGGGGAVGMVSVNRALADRPETTRSAGAVLARIGPRQPIRLEAVVALSCQKMNVTLTEVAGRGRHPRVVLARALATLLARKHTRASYPEIARAVGRPNHSTVITAHQRLDALLARNSVADCGDGRGPRPVADIVAECSGALAAGQGAPVGQTQTA
ncbi:MAG: DnaA/Hda family protein [Phycisphaerales bacterium]|nr:DnaA/Hda family protein [Phycisphaerales bacterium]